MPRLPSHNNRNLDDREPRFRLSALVIRRLGITFILLLTIVSGICLTLTSVLSHSLALPPPLFNTPLIPFTRFLRADSESESKYEWDHIRPGGHCLRYSTREYTARLLQLSGQNNPSEAMQTCRDLPIEIHGDRLESGWCQDLGFGRGIYGFWVVNFKESDCETRWGEFNDLGCSDSFGTGVIASAELSPDSEGKVRRRIVSRLENLQSGSNWQIMCATTPAEIYGRHFGGPTSCFYNTEMGVYGEWEVEDMACT